MSLSSEKCCRCSSSRACLGSKLQPGAIIERSPTQSINRLRSLFPRDRSVDIQLADLFVVVQSPKIHLRHVTQATAAIVARSGRQSASRNIGSDDFGIGEQGSRRVESAVICCHHLIARYLRAQSTKQFCKLNVTFALLYPQYNMLIVVCSSFLLLLLLLLFPPLPSSCPNSALAG